MKTNKKVNVKTMLIAGLILLAASSCKQQLKPEAENKPETTEEAEGLTQVVLTGKQVAALSIKADTMPKYSFKDVVMVNGYLNVPPQNKASVTAVIGANVASINVFEGDKVAKGQVIAYLQHPNLLDVQTEYISTLNQMIFMEKEYQRQKKLFEENISSGKDYQKAQSDYFMLKGDALNLKAKLKLLQMDPEKIENGKIYEKVPVISPIEGYIEKVEIKTGQFVEPQKPMFEVINTNKVHADLMVFEKDVYKVKTGQKVFFTIESAPGRMMRATLFAVGKTFEQNPKAVHVHAEIDNKQGVLIPGMYITGRIATNHKLEDAIPDEGVVVEDGKSYIFTAEKSNNSWIFTPVEIVAGLNEDNWTEVKLLSPLKKGTKVALSGAYYLLSEMKKDETGDDD